MSAPTQSFSEALMHARNVAYVLKHSVGESQALIVSLNSGILENALNEIERAHQAELGKAGGQPAHPSDHAVNIDSLSGGNLGIAFGVMRGIEASKGKNDA